ncbi:hypothetical protein VTN77DRAFT_3838 [Rasamsonia byssochlamydoides]|uniref:uncharacterized protein n=1 Tax=Rasamsonia byssochlamydoides TaxID=89139 RepID=UPI0037434209
MKLLAILPLFLAVASARTIYRYSDSYLLSRRSTSASSNSGNFQTFTSALGGAAAPPVTNSGDAQRPFEVNGDTFVNLSAALQRSCDIQFNACADIANSEGNKSGGLTVAECQVQENSCQQAASSTSSSSSSSSAAVAAQAASSSSVAASSCSS